MNKQEEWKITKEIYINSTGVPKVNNELKELIRKNNEINANQIRYEPDERVLEAKELYYLYKGMSESMQKAVKDIMFVANGLEIEDDK